MVSGQVHGVFFRDTCRRRAGEHGVAGWVRNLPDGTVEAVFEGDPASVQKLVDWAREGPPMATVNSVSVQEEEPEGLSSFEVRETPGGF
ncbi:acylphosphatase [Streptomyces inhibens]|uniref:acylphosphatase n=1 Tax=Streptomyces inhibens TaxID=2293571 RepID=A0A371PZV0_STRIH|nr:acylphosphatase [Streptomyces inhibens]